jgi:hypothetical protein
MGKAGLREAGKAGKNNPFTHAETPRKERAIHGLLWPVFSAFSRTNYAEALSNSVKYSRCFERRACQDML